MVYLPYPKEVIKHFKHPKNLGKIKNPDAVGEAGNLLCVLPNTQIHTNGKLLPIQNVGSGVLVLSHEGEFCPVRALHRRYYKGKVISIVSRIGKVTLTPDHLVFARKIQNKRDMQAKKKTPLAWYHAVQLKEGDIVVFPMGGEYLNAPIKRIEVENYRGFVYNLEVEGAHSFVANYLTLHNCGDVMRIYLKIREKKGDRIISDVKGEVFGCVVAVANTSMLTSMVKGRSLEEALKIRKEELLEKLGGRKKLPPIKIHCSILALDALKEAIYNYYKQKRLPIPKKLENEHRRIQKTIQKIEKRHKELLELERGLLR